MNDLADRLERTIRDVPDFPQPGVVFKDITPVLADPELMEDVVQAFAVRFRDAGVDAVVGMESRGFLFGAPLALALRCAFVPARKPGKLPWKTIGHEYALEYGTNRLELHVDALRPGQRALVVDDLLATGGTARATCALVRELGAEVLACCFVVELGFLGGRKLLEGTLVESLIRY
ncbi:MAG: adenine phosphoribosyltransferase [Deltaproteobacteria bacterium]|nr:adenine phosphoribosyltransferase [Deltaproteobacteria bacterium]